MIRVHHYILCIIINISQFKIAALLVMASEYFTTKAKKSKCLLACDNI